MKTLSGFLAAGCLLVFVLGCGLLGGSKDAANSSAANTANAAPAKAQKAVDISSLIGKSVEEVKKTLGPPASEIAGSPKWEFPQGDLSLQPVYKDEKKVDSFVFSAKIIVVGGQVGQGFSTYDKLGDLIGFDTRGKTPTQDEPGDTGSVYFENVDINGKSVHEVRFEKISGSFVTVYIRPVKKS